MIDFSTLQGLTIPEGVVTQIADAAGNVLWALSAGGPVILEVEKITSNTYAGETTYSSEEFILLDIYPKTNGTVSITYGDLTKTITDTSGAEEPNAQQVFFGTFNGVSDEVETPTSGTLTIEGDCYAFGGSKFSKSSKDAAYCLPICSVTSFGPVDRIPQYAFGNIMTASPNKFDQTELKILSSIKRIGNGAFTNCTTLETVVITNGVESILEFAFSGCSGLMSVTIPKSVKGIGYSASDEAEPGSNPFRSTAENNILSVDENNPYYRIDGNCLVEVNTNRLVSGFSDSVIPSYITWLGKNCFGNNTSIENMSIPDTVTTIDDYAFYGCTGLTSVNIPENVTSIRTAAFMSCTGLTSITIPEGITEIGQNAFSSCTGLTSITVLAPTPPTLGAAVFYNCTAQIIVPAGCGDTYKAADGWSTYADYIVEAA